jgi:hypothetical protein
VSVTAGGGGVYTYAQNGATSLKAGGSVGTKGVIDATGNIATIPLVIETSTGDVSVQAGRTIDISDDQVHPGLKIGLDTANVVTLSGLSLIQNASYLINLYPKKHKGQDLYAPGHPY